MSYKEIERRLKRLEMGTEAHGVVYAVHLGSEIVICGTDERVPVGEFAQRYPSGVIVKVLAPALWEAI